MQYNNRAIEQYSNRRKGQALIFVFFLLLLVGIIVGALAVMWQAEIQARSENRDSLIAFYIAQAGIERAKIELAYDEDWPLLGGGPFDPTTFGGGTYSGSVQDIACPPGPYNTCKEITSIGRIRNADRRLVTDVSLDSPPADPPDTPGDEEEIPWTWREN